MKEDLRPCKVTFVKMVGLFCEEEEREEHNAYFHTWHEEEYSGKSGYALQRGGQKTQLLAVVEFEDGSIHLVKPHEITFTDRDCKD